MPLDNPQLRALVSNMYGAMCRDGSDTCLFRPTAEAALKTILDGRTPHVARDLTRLDEYEIGIAQSCKDLMIPFLEEEHKRLGIASMSPEEIQRMNISFSSSTSVGWGIPALAGAVFFKMTDQAFDERTHPVIAGSNPQKSVYDEDDFIRIETLPYITPLEKLTGITNADRISFMDLNADIIEYLDFQGEALRELKTSDFGVRLFYRQENGIWQQVANNEAEEVSHANGKYTLRDDKEVQPVPYMLDTDGLVEGRPLDIQRKMLLGLLKSNDGLTDLAPTAMPINTKKNIIECYLAFKPA